MTKDQARASRANVTAQVLAGSSALNQENFQARVLPHLEARSGFLTAPLQVIGAASWSCRAYDRTSNLPQQQSISRVSLMWLRMICRIIQDPMNEARLPGPQKVYVNNHGPKLPRIAQKTHNESGYFLGSR